MDHQNLAMQALPAAAVDALFQDLCRPLDLDFAEDLSLLGAPFNDPVQEAWHRNAALSNIASQGAPIRSVVTSGFSGSAQPAWKAWSPSDDPIMEVEPKEQSSADSIPSTSYQQNSGSPLQLQEVKMECTDNPKLDPGQPSRMSARQAAQLEKDRERAEKLKEKNKRAQRKFRQRQKDRQESAEKLASELADQLKVVQLEKESLENRNRVLEKALNTVTSGSAVGSGPLAETEPTFIPAKGWDVFNPTGGLVLVAICNPPRKFTHQQMMSLSLRDMAKIMSELARLLRECLSDYNLDPPNPTAAARIQALLWERHAIMAYLAVNSPQMCYRVLTSKMSDPPVPNCPAASPALWADILRSIQMTPQQKKNVMEARVIYLNKIGEALLERHELRKQVQALELIPSTTGNGRVSALHLEWSDIVSKLKANVELCHRCHAYFMARVWYRDCFTPLQVARFIAEAHPYPVDIFAVIRELAAQLGEPSYTELMERECGKDRITQASLPVDANLDQWPNFLSKEGRENYKQHIEEESSPDPEVAKFSNRIPNDEAITT